MRIKILKLKKTNFSPKIKAVFSMLLEDYGLTIHEMKAVEGSNGIFYAFPAFREWDFENKCSIKDEEGKDIWVPYIEMTHPHKDTLREDITKALKAYKQKSEKQNIQESYISPPVQKVIDNENIPF